ncbi:hypothetical protein ACRAWG_25940 [Methylobacterium sp. P31]
MEPPLRAYLSASAFRRLLAAGAALVRLRAAQAMGRIGTRAVQDGIAQAALAHFGSQFGKARVQGCGVSVSG